MEEPSPVTVAEPPAPKPPTTSLGARLLNVFAVPGDVFDEVKASPGATANWLVPALLLALVGAISAVIIASQPAIQQQVREQQAKMLDKQVEAGKMTREQADKTLAVAEKFTGPAMLKVLGSISAVFVSFARVFWWGFILWLLGRTLLKTPVVYPKTLEVAGLALMISVLGTVVTLLLTVNLGRMFATPSLALAVSDFDATRKSHLMLGTINVFSFWLVGVMSVGLARLSGASFMRAAFPVLAFWVLEQSFFILAGLGQFAQ